MAKSTPINCQHCGFLMVEFENTGDTITINSHGFGVRVDPALLALGIAVAVCGKCQKETQFPAALMPGLPGKSR